jgi:LuxR family maltose regulon positive regulatory protein
MARSRHTDSPYFPARLQAKVREAMTMRSLLIEAPSGYGKTTLTQNLLRKRLPGGTAWVRHLGAEETPRAAWRRFCQCLQNIDGRAGKALLALGPPDGDSAGEAADLLREMPCSRPSWLVLDDFQHIAALAPASVWKAFLEHDSPLLRLAIVTRPLAASLMAYEKAGYFRLGVDDLRLTEPESRECAARAGVALSWEEAEKLYRLTEGWMIALSLHLRHWRQNGNFAPASGLDGLIRDVIWNGLDDSGRDLLLRLSPFDRFSSAQANFFLEQGGRPLPAGATAALRRNALLRFDSASGLYYPHSALLEFTRARFAELPESEQRTRLYAAGDWGADHGGREAAAALYYRLGDFEKILALDLGGMKDNRLLDKPDLAYAEALRDIAAHCTKGMKVRHPLSCLRLAFELFGQGCRGEFAALCSEMAGLVETEAPEGERDYLRGELLLLEAFGHYNNIAEMGERMRRASELTGGKTALARPDNSWTFGNVSVLFMYHRDAGRLDGEIADMKRYCPHYVGMTGGHGGGGAELMEAEALLCRGDAGGAEILGHKARREAAPRGQASVLLGVEFLFGRLAVMRGNAAAFAAALENLALIAEEHPQKSNRFAADLARSFLASLVHRPDDMADWLRGDDPGSLARRLFVPALPFAELCRARHALLTEKPERLLGESEAALSLAAALHCPLATIYGLIHRAAARGGRGEGEAARDSLRRALDLALPDRLFLPFAENRALIGEPMEALLPEMDSECAASILALAEQVEAGRRALAGASPAKRKFGLTRREDETVRLMAEGFTYGEIARQLYISLNTVKTHLKTAYQKTGTSSRPILKKILR